MIIIDNEHLTVFRIGNPVLTLVTSTNSVIKTIITGEVTLRETTIACQTI